MVMEGHRQRLYQRFEDVGIHGFAEHEKLELLLTLVISRKDCKPLAKALLKKFGSLLGVFHADRRDLEQLEGLGSKTSLLLTILKAVMAETFKEQVSQKPVFFQAQAVVDYLMMARDRGRQEVFKVLFLDAQHQLIAEEELSQGTIDQAPVYVRNIVEMVIKHNAKAVILCHNHPSGHPKPSQADKDITFNIQEALSLIHVNVLDHLILGDHRYISFVEKGMLK